MQHLCSGEVEAGFVVFLVAGEFLADVVLVGGVFKAGVARPAADAGLPVKTAFRLAQVWKQALAQMQCYEEARINICRKYGTLNEETQKFEFPTDEAEKELHKEGRELLRIEVEIGGEPFLIDDFGPRKLTAGDFLSANDIVHLGWLIVERRDSQP